jgi:sec-independent protein translocase protein TatA
MGNVGPLELVIVLLIALVIFGPKRLPEIGRSLGHGIRGLRESLAGESEETADEGGRRESTRLPRLSAPAPTPRGDEPAEDGAPTERRTQ